MTCLENRFNGPIPKHLHPASFSPSRERELIGKLLQSRLQRRCEVKKNFKSPHSPPTYIKDIRQGEKNGKYWQRTDLDIL